MQKEVLVVIGAGGMGQAIARRVGSGCAIVVADVDERTVGVAASALSGEGHEVSAHPVDVADPDSVAGLAAAASSLGRVARVVHTAGLSPVQASSERILAVDLLGVAHVLESFGEVVAPGGAGVVVSSMAAYVAGAIPPEDEASLARTPARELSSLPFAETIRASAPGAAYGFAKRANQLRVRAESVRWGARGARINSISPGIISTSMGRAELAGPAGSLMNLMTAGSAARRLGTPDDIAAAAAFLLSREASFVTGIDLLVDGGVMAALLTGQIDFAAAPQLKQI